MSVVGTKVSTRHRGAGGTRQTNRKFRFRSGGLIARVVGLRAQSFWSVNLGGGAGGGSSGFKAFLQGEVADVIVVFWSHCRSVARMAESTKRCIRSPGAAFQKWRVRVGGISKLSLDIEASHGWRRAPNGV